MTHPIVIVGASMGGLRAAESLRKGGYTGALVLIGEERHAPYNRPPLSKEVLAEGVDHAAVAFALAPVLDDVEWMLGSPVISADLQAQSVTMADGRVVHYSALIIATGLRPRRLKFDAMPERGAHAIRTLDDAMALREELKPGARVVVYGAGFIGCEAAATARKLGAEVTVVGIGPFPLLRQLGLELARDIQGRQEAHGVRFIMNSSLARVVGTEAITGVVLNTGQVLECDVLIEAIGSEPNVDFLLHNDIDTAGGILVDSTLHAVKIDGTSWSNVFAIGDVARFPIPQFSQTSRRVEHWNMPTEMARKVGQLLSDERTQNPAREEHLAKPFAPIPTFWSDQFEVSLLSYGLLDDASDIRLLEGAVGENCVYGYYRADQLMGVCGIGMRSKVMGYRNRVGLPSIML